MELIKSITSDQWYAIVTCNALFYFSWAIGVLLKKNNEIKEPSEDITGTELYHDWLPKNK